MRSSGKHGAIFVYVMRKLMFMKDKLHVVHDQRRSPIRAADLFPAIISITPEGEVVALPFRTGMRAPALHQGTGGNLYLPCKERLGHEGRYVIVRCWLKPGARTEAGAQFRRGPVQDHTLVPRQPFIVRSCPFRRAPMLARQELYGTLILPRCLNKRKSRTK